MTRIAANLPKGEANGLEVVVRALLDTPHQVHVVIALLDCRSTKVDHETGDRIPTARVKRIEVVSEGDRRIVRRMIDRAYEQRMGATMLPFELEEDLNSAFGGEDE